MPKSACAVGVVLVVAALVSLPSLFSPQVQARAPHHANVDIAAVKGDRLDLPRLGTDCSQREWPYFEAACLRNTGTGAAPARLPRTVAVDRLPPLEDASGMVAAR